MILVDGGRVAIAARLAALAAPKAILRASSVADNCWLLVCGRLPWWQDELLVPPIGLC